MKQAATYGPYSPIRVAGDIVYVSGQVGVDPATSQASADLASQTKQCLTNLANLLSANDLSIDDVVKNTIFLKNMADFAVVNDIYVSFFNEPRPARSCVEVAGLPRVAGDTELLIEIEAVAHRGNS